MKVKKVMSDYTAQELSSLGEAASFKFESRTKNLLACFDAPKVYEAMAAMVRLNGLTDELKQDFSVSSLCRATCENFLTLLSRGVFDPFLRFPISETAQQELDALALDCGHGQGSVEDATGYSSSDTPEPTAEELLARQVIQDWQTLPTEAIRKKKANVPGYAAAVNTAISQGAI